MSVAWKNPNTFKNPTEQPPPVTSAAWSTTSYFNSTVSLSLVWLILCAGLVQKQRDLLQVFFSFLACFVAASLQGQFIACNVTTKRTVGAFACASALFLADSTFQTLSILAGYLAFDHWYSFLYTKPALQVRVVAEDALTLTASLVLLCTTQQDLLESSQQYYGTIVRLWLVQRLLRLIASLMLLNGSDKTSTNGLQSTTTTTTPKANSTLQEAKSTTTTRPPHEDTASSSSLWYIHGVAYDLEDYVSRHPGGEQAIRLGQGRDCTALFASYHPFTSQHVRVLQKYQIATTTTSTQTITLQKDEFYQVLCDRVSDALRKQGIDPVLGRTATRQRLLYYAVVVACVFASGRSHCKVRTVVMLHHCCIECMEQNSAVPTYLS
jgi:hypothetical protein